MSVLSGRRSVAVALLAGWCGLGGAAAAAAQGPTAQQMVSTMIAREQEACKVVAHFAYVSEERSERTGGHLWVERMVETNWGTVRFLIKQDGRPLSGENAAGERARLREAAADPEAYRRQENRSDDGERTRQLLTMLPMAFRFAVQSADGREIRILYRPDPEFTPRTLEERALHGIEGLLVLDASTLRLRSIEGHAPRDVSLGFGPLATLRAGSAFQTAREELPSADWKTARVRTSVQGRALLLKTLTKQQEYVHTGFERVPDTITLREAVALAER